jgi:integrase
VQRHARTEAAARRALATSVRDRSYDRGVDLAATDRVKVAAARWFAEPATQKLSPYTVEQYERVLRLHIVPDPTVVCPRCKAPHSGVGELRIRELTVGAAATFLRTVERTHGAPTARMVRSVLSGVAAWCTVRDLLPANPVRDSGRISTKPARPPRSLELDDVWDLLMWADYDNRSIARDVVDLLRFLLATGLRIGEAAAVRRCDIDLDSGFLAVTGNIIRIKGVGLVRQEDETSKLHPRVLELPSWAVDMIAGRLARRPVADDRPLFPAPLGGWRDPSNTQADLRDLLTFAGYPWMTSHTARKTVASLMADAGLSARDGADQLGHANPAMTQARYWGRRRVSSGAATVLEPIGRRPD